MGEDDPIKALASAVRTKSLPQPQGPGFVYCAICEHRCSAAATHCPECGHQLVATPAWIRFLQLRPKTMVVSAALLVVSVAAYFFVNLRKQPTDTLRADTARDLVVSILTASEQQELPAKYAHNEDCFSISEVWNAGFSNTRVSLDTADGTLELRFDYDGTLFVETQERTRSASGLSSQLHHGPGPQSLLIRFFDRNGEYITHFVTKERYYAEGLSDEWLTYWKDWNGSRRLWRATSDEPLVFAPILRRENSLVYRLNMRDTAVVERCEIGWYPISLSGRLRDIDIVERMHTDEGAVWRYIDLKNR